MDPKELDEASVEHMKEILAEAALNSPVAQSEGLAISIDDPLIRALAAAIVAKELYLDDTGTQYIIQIIRTKYATKAELEAARTELRNLIESVRSSLDHKIDETRTDLTTLINNVNTNLSTAISNINSFDYSVVSSLPITGKKGTLYLVPTSSSNASNQYDEYIYVNNRFEFIGTTAFDPGTIDMSAYVPKRIAGSDGVSYAQYGTLMNSLGLWGLGWIVRPVAYSNDAKFIFQINDVIEGTAARALEALEVRFVTSSGTGKFQLHDAIYTYLNAYSNLIKATVNGEVKGSSGFDITNIISAVINSLSSSYLPIAGGTLKGDLTLKTDSSNFGTKLNFGDGDYVHLSEPTDDHLEIKASYVNFVIGSGTPGTGKFTVNGIDIPLTAASSGNTISKGTAAPTSSSPSSPKVGDIYIRTYA